MGKRVSEETIRRVMGNDRSHDHLIEEQYSPDSRDTSSSIAGLLLRVKDFVMDTSKWFNR